MIVTFYSYKGGVGRTQLLVNLASYLCYNKNKKVLLLEWDLEAPGLHYYFDKKNSSMEKEGLIELLQKYVEMMQEKGLRSTKELPYFNNHNIEKLRISANGQGCIDLIPCAKYNEPYNQKINNFDWVRFVENLDGKVYIETLKEEIKKLGYDFVFVDSRTGITDYSGLCNIILPDMNVIVVAPTEQNFEGSKRIAESIYNNEYRTKGYRMPYMMPILSRIDDNVTEKSKFIYWMDKYINDFSFMLDSVLDERVKPIIKYYFQDVYVQNTTIFYNNNMSLGENILFKENTITNYDRTSIYFENIANHILEIKEKGTFNTKDMMENFILQSKKKYKDGEAQISLAETESNLNMDYIFLRLNNLNLRNLPEKVYKLKKINSIDISNNNFKKIPDLSVFDNLSAFSANYNKIDDLHFLSKNINFTIVSLSMSYNKIYNISILGEFKNIWDLRLNNNLIEDITPLTNLKNLAFLLLGNNKIKDILPIKDIPNLNYIALENNKITNIDALYNLHNIQGINLYGNPISEDDIQKLRNSLPKCEIIFSKEDVINEVSKFSESDKIDYIFEKYKITIDELYSKK